MVIISAELATDFNLKTNTEMYITVVQGLECFKYWWAGYVVAEPSEEFSVSILLHCTGDPTHTYTLSSHSIAVALHKPTLHTRVNSSVACSSNGLHLQQ